MGLAAMLTTSTLALKQLRVGGPLYTQIKLGSDLVADILPPPAYIIEAYLEATLALRRLLADLSGHAAKLAKLHKDYGERKELLDQGSDLEDGIKKLLTADSDAEVQETLERRRE
ncbi:MAG: hypothetical protein MZV49_03855 [Rhodopseudomonas palustris]|nr:hypothetical protein [Rhodopseudomonas palustris]